MPDHEASTVDEEDMIPWDCDGGLELEIEYDYDVSTTGFEGDD